MIKKKFPPNLVHGKAESNSVLLQDVVLDKTVSNKWITKRGSEEEN